MTWDDDALARTGVEEIDARRYQDDTLLCAYPDTVLVVLCQTVEIVRLNRLAVLVHKRATGNTSVVTAHRRCATIVQQYQTRFLALVHHPFPLAVTLVYPYAIRRIEVYLALIAVQLQAVPLSHRCLHVQRIADIGGIEHPQVTLLVQHRTIRTGEVVVVYTGVHSAQATVHAVVVLHSLIVLKLKHSRTISRHIEMSRISCIYRIAYHITYVVIRIVPGVLPRYTAPLVSFQYTHSRLTSHLRSPAASRCYIQPIMGHLQSVAIIAHRSFSTEHSIALCSQANQSLAFFGQPVLAVRVHRILSHIPVC